MCTTRVLNLVLLQGRAARRGYLLHADYCTFVNSNFSTRFFAQIVENRETQLSSLFLGPGGIFLKIYDENRFVCSCMAPEILRFAQQIVRARCSAGTTSPDLVFVITVRKNIPRT
jgi:hypothetical protein